MIVASGEEDGSGLVSDEALGDPIRTEVRRGGGGVRFLRNGGLIDDFDGQGVSARAWFEMIDLDEDGFLLLLRSLSSGRRLVITRRWVSSVAARRRRTVSLAGSLVRRLRGGVVGGV